MILVTGGAGYVGSVLVPELVKRNHKVRVFDSFIFGSRPLEKIRGKIEIIKGDVRNPPAKIFNNIDLIFHLAGLSNDPTANFDPKANYEINTLGTVKIARLAKKNNVRRFIFASSCSIYDQGLQDKHDLLNEKSKVNPLAPYSYSKFMAEKQILPLADNFFEVVVARKGTIFGYSPRLRFDLVVNTMVKDAFKTGRLNVLCKGRQWRPLISVNDTVRGYLLLMKAQKRKINSQIFNLLSYNVRIIAIAKLVKKSLDKYFPIEIDVDDKIIETRSYKVSNSKIIKELGFSPKDTLSDAIVDLYNKTKSGKIGDFDNPNYYNIEWMKLLYQKGETKCTKKSSKS